MIRTGPACVLLIILAEAVLPVALAGDAPAIPAIQMLPGPGGDVTRATFEVVGLGRSDLDALARETWGVAEWNRLFRVTVSDSDHPLATTERPPIVGRYEISGDRVRFRPRFPLERGLSYRAVYDPAALPAGKTPASGPISAVFLVAKPTTRPAVVRRVDPTVDEVPENLLKFYLHFSAPMSRGDVYRYIHLTDSAGHAVDLPFLEIGEELWDRTGMRLTLLIDPGRIKRGLRPREESGPVLVRGKRYELTIDRAWPDANGQPLQSAYQKTFRVGPADEIPPDPKQWRIGSPKAATRSALVIDFPEPLDRALLDHVIAVRDARGGSVQGAVTVSDDARRWELVPERPWPPGRHELLVERSLEDLAGNQVGRPFEVDVFEGVPARPAENDFVVVPFEVR